jgi:ribonuclease Y
MNPNLVIFPSVALVTGAIIGYIFRKMVVAKNIESAEKKAQGILDDAKAKYKEYLLKAKDKEMEILEGMKKEENFRRRELKQIQERLQKRESMFDQKLMEFESKQQKLYEKAQQVEEVKKKIQELHAEEVKKLEDIAKMSQEEAKQLLIEKAEKNASEDVLNRIRKIEATAVEEMETKARKILATAIQRCSVSHFSEFMTTTVDLPSDEMKGRIIGKEGRNIKAVEQLTGVEIIVDDTPQAITISGFSPIRRQIAKLALESLIADGRIHPGRIEEAIETARKHIALEIQKAGEDAVYQLGIAGLDPKLIQILGRLKYRTSFGQNVLNHSIEVAHISTLLAEELRADVSIAKKGGLLHDIGKAVDHEVQGGHPQIGYDIMKKFGLPEEVAYLSIAHHEDAPHTIEGIICKVADAMSGGRPGARSDNREQYLQRLEELEKVAVGFQGIQKAYAIQAGREIRVFVVPELIDDLKGVQLAREIAHQIEANLRYPGEVKVTVIRENRFIEYAR